MGAWTKISRFFANRDCGLWYYEHSEERWWAECRLPGAESTDRGQINGWDTGLSPISIGDYGGKVRYIMPSLRCHVTGRHIMLHWTLGPIHKIAMNRGRVWIHAFRCTSNEILNGVVKMGSATKNDERKSGGEMKGNCYAPSSIIWREVTDKCHKLDSKIRMQIRQGKVSEPCLGRDSTRIIEGEDRNRWDVQVPLHS